MLDEIEQLEEELCAVKKKIEQSEKGSHDTESLEAENERLKKAINNWRRNNTKLEHEIEKLKRKLQSAMEEQQSAGGESDSESNVSARSQSRRRSSKRSKSKK